MGILTDESGAALTDDDLEPLTDGLDQPFCNGAAFSVPQNSLAQVVQRIIDY